MLREISFKDEGGRARGRNGYFVPAKVEASKDVDGRLLISVFSKKVGKTEPIYLRISMEDVEALAGLLVSFLPKKKRNGFPVVDVVATIKSGLLESVMANRSGVYIYVLDQDGQAGSPDHRHIKLLAPYLDEVEEIDANAFGMGLAAVDPKNVAQVIGQINDPDTVWDTCPECKKPVLAGDLVEVTEELSLCPDCAVSYEKGETLKVPGN